MPNIELDYIPQDSQVPNQKYAVVSIVGPNVNSDVWAIKVSGVYKTEEEAEELIAELRKRCTRLTCILFMLESFFHW